MPQCCIIAGTRGCLEKQVVGVAGVEVGVGGEARGALLHLAALLDRQAHVRSGALDAFGGSWRGDYELSA
jgi:hypothetical protein